MKDVYTVAFFGHRRMDGIIAVEEKIAQLARELMKRKEYVEFLVGMEGDFDRIAASAVRREKRRLDAFNASLVCVLPYLRKEYKDNEAEFEAYFDEIEICRESEAAHFKAAIEVRNRAMAERAELVVCYLERETGGAFKAVRYAERLGKRVINLRDAEFDG